MESCLKGTGDCEVIDRWQPSQAGEAVRSVSLSYNACYLASGGMTEKSPFGLLHLKENEP